MITAIVSTRCKDFDTWRPAFEGHAAARKEHGCSGAHVYRSIQDPNDLTIVFNWSSAEAMGKFMSDPEVQKKIAEAGTIGAPIPTLCTPAGSYPA